MRKSLVVMSLLCSACFYRLDQFPIELKEGDIQVILEGVPPAKIGVQPLPGGRVTLSRSGVTRTARDDGRVVLRNVPAGDHVLNLIYDPNGDRIPDLAARIEVPIRIRDDGATRPAVDLGRIRLLEPATITGTIDVAGEGVDPATVTVAVDGYDLLVTPDANGTFVIPGLGAGAWTVVASGTGVVSDPLDFSVEPGERKTVGSLRLRRPTGEPAEVTGVIQDEPAQSLTQALNGQPSVVASPAGNQGEPIPLRLTGRDFSGPLPEGAYTLTIYLDDDHRTVVLPGVILRAGQHRDFVITPGEIALEKEGPCKGLYDLDGDGQCFLDPRMQGSESGGRWACEAECLARTDNRDAPCTLDGTWDCDDDGDAQPDFAERACACTVPDEDAPGDECLVNTARFDVRDNGICDIAEPFNTPSSSGSSSSSSSSGGSSSSLEPSSSSVESSSSSVMGTSSSMPPPTGCVVLAANQAGVTDLPWGETQCFEVPFGADTSGVLWHAGTAMGGPSVDTALDREASYTVVYPVTQLRADGAPLVSMRVQDERTLLITASVSTGRFTINALAGNESFSAEINVRPPSWTPPPAILDVSAGERHTLILLERGNPIRRELWMAGTFGNPDSRHTFDRAVPMRGDGDEGIFGDVLKIRACDTHALILRRDGTVATIGDFGWQPTRVDNTQSLPLANVVEIACGRAHNLALAMDGTLYAWGDNARGQLGTGDTMTTFDATPVVAPWPATASIAAIAAGGDNSAVLVRDAGNTAVYVWGASDLGVTMTRTADVLAPRAVTFPAAAAAPVIESIALGPTSAFAVTTAHTVFGWGTHPAFLGRCTGADEMTTSPFTLFANLNCSTGQNITLTDAREVFPGRRHVVISSFSVPGRSYGAGENFDGQLRDPGILFSRTAVIVPLDPAFLRVGADHTITMATPPLVEGTGSNAFSQLGLGELLDASATPRSVRYELCGNREKDVDEACENTPNCDARCHITSACGDGVPTGGECDEGDIDPDGICDASCGCQLAAQRCGDGEHIPMCEECDDANTINGDGCSSTCTFEMASTAGCYHNGTATLFSSPVMVGRTCRTFVSFGSLGDMEDVAYYAMPADPFIAIDVVATRDPDGLCGAASSMNVGVYTTSPTAPRPSNCMMAGALACDAPTDGTCGEVHVAPLPTTTPRFITVGRPIGVTGAISYRLVISLR